MSVAQVMGSVRDWPPPYDRNRLAKGNAVSGSRFSVRLLVGSLCLFILSLLASIPLMPDRMATHFDGLGQANGWMNRWSHLAFISATGVGVPLFIVGLGRIVRYLPSSAIDLPHKDYWLADERRLETTDFLYHHLIRFASWMVTFFLALHWLIVFGNRLQPPQLPVLWIAPTVGTFLTGTLVWIIVLYRRFRSPPLC